MLSSGLKQFWEFYILVSLNLVQYFLKAQFHFDKNQFADLMIIGGVAGAISQVDVCLSCIIICHYVVLLFCLRFWCSFGNVAAGSFAFVGPCGGRRKAALNWAILQLCSCMQLPNRTTSILLLPVYVIRVVDYFNCFLLYSNDFWKSDWNDPLF